MNNQVFHSLIILLDCFLAVYAIARLVNRLFDEDLRLFDQGGSIHVTQRKTVSVQIRL